MEDKEDILRHLTLGETRLARNIFGNSIQYHKVWIHCDSYLPFGLQGKMVGMAPNGEIYFRKETYERDFSFASRSSQHFFIHELTHVWQHQHGMWVRTRGLFSWLSSYIYTLDERRKLADYNMEQQAQIIADYFLLKKYGSGTLRGAVGLYAGFAGKVDAGTLPLFRKILPPDIQ
jgi:hypothetical protein